MDLTRVRAALARNKVPFAAAGALVVVVAALVARSKGAAGSSSTPAASSGLSKYPAYYTTGNGGAYDSSGTDVYNALEGPLTSLTDAVNRLTQQQQPATPTPVPAPDPTPGATPQPAPRFLGLIQKAGSPDIYERRSDNTLRHISYDEWAGAKFPGFATVDAGDPVWTSKVVG